MAFLSKEELQVKCQQYGIDMEGKTWPQLQKEAITAMKAAGEEFTSPHQAKPKTEQQLDKANEEKLQKKIKELEEQLASMQNRQDREQGLPETPVEQRAEDNLIARYKGKRVLVSPELAPTQYQRYTYEEVLGEDIKVETKMTVRTPGQVDFVPTVVGRKSSKPVTAVTTMPKQNASLSLEIGKDLFMVAEFMGKKGYLFKHPNPQVETIKGMLMREGFWNTYQDEFKQPGVIFYLTGLACCDINWTHGLLERIAREARKQKLIDDAAAR